jgi:hypothetical protein
MAKQKGGAAAGPRHRKELETFRKKRIGRPTKPPKPGERVSLGLRVTPQMKQRLERAAIRKGRSLSQEAEYRLEASLDSDDHLILVQGTTWSPVIFRGDEMLVYVGGNEAISLKIDRSDRAEMLDYFRKHADEEREPLREEVEEAGERYMEMLRDIERGK